MHRYPYDWIGSETQALAVAASEVDACRSYKEDTLVEQHGYAKMVTTEAGELDGKTTVLQAQRIHNASLSRVGLLQTMLTWRCKHF